MRSLNRSNKANFLSVGTDYCQLCWLDHVVKKKKRKSYFYPVGLCCYIKKLFLLKPCSREMDTSARGKQDTVEGTAERVHVFALGIGTLNGTWL